MTVPTAARVVRIRRYLEAPPERVFTAWTDPNVLARWISPVGHAVVSIDPRPGGRLQVTMVGEGRQIEHVGEYREIIPNRRLVFTWQSSYTGPDPSVVTIELESRDGGTELTLVHAALPHDAVDSHAGGWSHILDRLAAVLAGASPATSHQGESIS